MKDTEERSERMSDDFMEDEFERDWNEAFRLIAQVGGKMPLIICGCIGK